MSKIYPFKFLDAYSKEDTSLFFGRDEEINAMYEMIFQTKILFVYGASGTGKTSLIQCGLASKFQSHDWLALYIRRGKNINESFEKVISEAGGSTESAEDTIDFSDIMSDDDEDAAPAKELSPLAKSFKAIYLNSFKPVYLIFDQFEELFIFGTKEEQAQFTITVREILKLEQPVKMIFSMREEYLGNLYAFEKAVPELLRKKIRVEPMNLDKVRQVILGATTLKDSNVKVAEGELGTLTEGIFDKIKGKENTLTIQLPYLQVFLDRLYMDIAGDENRREEAVFTTKELTKLGDIGDVLNDYLERQVAKIAIKQSTPEVPVSNETIWKILSPFATLEGTKEPTTMKSLLERFPELDQGLIKSTVYSFVNSRILRHTEENDLYELAHDALAVKIAGNRSTEDVGLLQAKKIIKNYLNLNKQGEDLISPIHLNIIRPYLERLNLSDEEKELVAESERRLVQQKKYRKRLLVAVSTLVILVLSYMSYSTYKAVQYSKKALFYVLSGQAYREIKSNHDISKGFLYSAYAFDNDPENSDIKKLLYACVYQPMDKPHDIFCKFSLSDSSEILSVVPGSGKDIVLIKEDSTVVVWRDNEAKFSAKYSLKNFILNHDSKNVPADVIGVFNDSRILRVFDSNRILKNDEQAVSISYVPGSNDYVLIRKGPGKFMSEYHVAGGGISNAKDYAILSEDYVNPIVSPDCNFVCVSCEKSYVKVFDSKTGELIYSINTDTIKAQFAAFTPDSKRLFVGYDNQMAAVYDIIQNTDHLSYDHFPNNIGSVIFSPDGSSFLSYSKDGPVNLWNFDKPDGTQLRKTGTLPENSKRTNRASFLPDGKGIWTTADNSVRLWDIGMSFMTMFFRGIWNRADFSIFSPDHSRGFVISNGMGKYWDVTNCRETGTLNGTLVKNSKAFFSDDGTKLITYHFGDSTVKRWDNKGAFIDSIAVSTDIIEHVNFSPDLSYMWNSFENNIVIYTIANGKVKPLGDSLRNVCRATFSRDGAELLTFQNNGMYKKWDLKTMKVLDSCSLGNIIQGDINSVNAFVYFSADRSRMVAMRKDSTLLFLNLAEKDRKPEEVKVKWASQVKTVFSDDNESILIIPDNGPAVLKETGELPVVLNVAKGESSTIVDGKFSPDNNLLIIKTIDRKVKVYDIDEGVEIFSAGNIYDAIFSPDSKMLLTKSEFNLKLWDIEKQFELITLPSKHAQNMYFSPGKRNIRVLVENDNLSSSIYLTDPLEIIQEFNRRYKIQDLSREEKKRMGIN